MFTIFALYKSWTRDISQEGFLPSGAKGPVFRIRILWAKLKKKNKVFIDSLNAEKIIQKQFLNFDPSTLLLTGGRPEFVG